MALKEHRERGETIMWANGTMGGRWMGGYTDIKGARFGSERVWFVCSRGQNLLQAGN